MRVSSRVALESKLTCSRALSTLLGFVSWANVSHPLVLVKVLAMRFQPIGTEARGGMAGCARSTNDATSTNRKTPVVSKQPGMANRFHGGQ